MTREKRKCPRLSNLQKSGQVIVNQDSKEVCFSLNSEGVTLVNFLKAV